MTQDAELIDNDDTVIEADVRPLPEPDASDVKALPEPPATPSTAVALELPPTGNELLAYAGRLERIIERAKKSSEPGMGEWGTVTQFLKNAASSLRSAIGHTL